VLRVPFRLLAAWSSGDLARLPGETARKGCPDQTEEVRLRAGQRFGTARPVIFQALPGLGEKNCSLSALSFQSSASSGAVPLRVIFGHSAA
jgi:hypothetical protein